MIWVPPNAGAKLSWATAISTSIVCHVERHKTRDSVNNHVASRAASRILKNTDDQSLKLS